MAANAVGLMVQACEATAGLAGNMLLRLGRGAQQHTFEDLSELAAGVACEDPPVQNTRRFLAADARLCGVPVRAGDAVLVLLAAASCAAPAGAAGRPWTFGVGRHACPGDALAQAAGAGDRRSVADPWRAAGRARAGVPLPAFAYARIPHFH